MIKRSGSALLIMALFTFTIARAEDFRNARYLYKADGDDKGQEVWGTLTVDTTSKQIRFASYVPKKHKKKSPPEVALDIKTDAVTSGLYERSSRPRYLSAIFIAWPLIFTKGKKHFLTLQYTSEAEGKYAIFHMDKNNFRAILAAVEASTGKKLERSEEH